MGDKFGFAGLQNQHCDSDDHHCNQQQTQDAYKQMEFAVINFKQVKIKVTVQQSIHTYYNSPVW